MHPAGFHRTRKFSEPRFCESFSAAIPVFSNFLFNIAIKRLDKGCGYGVFFGQLFRNHGLPFSVSPAVSRDFSLKREASCLRSGFSDVSIAEVSI